MTDLQLETCHDMMWHKRRSQAATVTRSGMLSTIIDHRRVTLNHRDGGYSSSQEALNMGTHLPWHRTLSIRPHSPMAPSTPTAVLRALASVAASTGRLFHPVCLQGPQIEETIGMLATTPFRTESMGILPCFWHPVPANGHPALASVDNPSDTTTRRWNHRVLLPGSAARTS